MVERLRALTSGPFGVDLICAHTGLGPASTDWHIDLCVQLDVPQVVFHHDPPPARWIGTLRTEGIRVWMQASSPELAAAAIELGVNGIVAQGSEAGGTPANTSRCTRCYGQSVTSGLTCCCWEQAAYPMGPPQPLRCARALTECG
jgi:NAD(P)H-dependent flavin oxidoreductase YrpB (nitropropane dioxygenase family)